MRVVLKFFVASVLGMAASGAAGAQPAKPADQKPAPVPAATPASAEPQATTASFGDWVLRCQHLGADKDSTRLCEVDQIIQVQGQNAPVAQVGIVRPQKSEPLRATVVLPINVTFPSAPKISFDGKQPIELSWRRCVPVGCVADVALSDETLRLLRAAQGAGKIESRDGAGRDFSLAISSRGLSQALDALAREQ